MDPLVVTLALAPDDAARFDRERADLFPADRTRVGAHVTLFHAVPGELGDAVTDAVRDACRRDAFDVEVTEVFGLGRGVAYRLRSDALSEVHRPLQRSWWDHLTPQDRQGFRAHVTVQNKVTPEVARRTLQRLTAAFSPFAVRATGIALWRYVGGPWEPVRTVPFEGSGDSAS